MISYTITILTENKVTVNSVSLEVYNVYKYIVAFDHYKGVMFNQSQLVRVFNHSVVTQDQAIIGKRNVEHKPPQRTNK